MGYIDVDNSFRNEIEEGIDLEFQYTTQLDHEIFCMTKIHKKDSRQNRTVKCNYALMTYKGNFGERLTEKIINPLKRTKKNN